MIVTGNSYRQYRFVIFFLFFLIVGYALFYRHVYRNFPDIGSTFDTQYTMIAEYWYRDGIYSLGARDTSGTLLPTGTAPPLWVFLYFLSFKIFGVGRIAYEAMRVVQMLFAFGTILVVWRLGTLFSTAIGKAGALFAALDLTALYFAQNYHIPDTTIGFFMALWLFYLVKFFYHAPVTKNIFFSACFFGLALWTKISLALFVWPLFFFIFIVLLIATRIDRRKKIYSFLIFFFIISFFFYGWKIRNYYAVGYADFNMAAATSLRENVRPLLAYQQGISTAEAEQQLMDTYFTPEARHDGEGAFNRRVSKELTSIILHSPIDFGVVVLKTMPGFFFGTFPPSMLFDKDGADQWAERIHEAKGLRALLPALWREGYIAYVAIYFLAKFHLLLLYGMSAIAVIAFAHKKQLRVLLALFFLTIAYVIAVSGGAAQARYRMMIFPIFYLLAGYGWVIIFRHFYRNRDGENVL